MYELFTKDSLAKLEWLGTTPIRLFGDPILRQKCKKVQLSKITSLDVQNKIVVLKSFLQNYRKNTGFGRGVAANQLGFNDRIFIIWDWDDDNPIAYINPKIIRKSGQAEYSESCISSAALIEGSVARPHLIDVKYIDEAGTNQTKILDEKHSRVFQHELDHLNGITCTDRYKVKSVKMVTSASRTNEINIINRGIL